ncbi:MAG: hypothetical protein DIU78_016235 [Pseudomonadota bacterium]|nr:MAG: hypothetical protein DIU78_21860 [Pseudomonadota bacterium]
MLRSLRVALSSLVLLCAAPALAVDATAASQENIRAAADAFDRGRDAYRVEDFAAAAEAFEAADRFAASATAIEYAIRAHDKAGQLHRAATVAVVAKARHPSEKKLQSLVAEVLGRAERELFELAVECSEPCELSVDSEIVFGKADFERTIFLPEGTHTIGAAFGQGRSETKEIVARRGGQGRLLFEAPPDPVQVARKKSKSKPESEADPEPQYFFTEADSGTDDAASSQERAEASGEGWSPAIFWVLVGATVAAGGATIASGLDALENPGEERLRDACRTGPREHCEALYSDGVRRQNRTNILLGTTVGLGLVTALVGVLATDFGASSNDGDDGLSARASGLRLEPWLVLGETAVAGAQGRF